MGQKVHPVGFRLGITQTHLSQWFAHKKKYSKYLCEDNFLRKKLQQQFENARLEKIEISRKIEGALALVIYAEIPEIIVGPKGKNLKNLQQNIKQTIEKYRQSKLIQATFGSNKPKYIQSLENFQKKKKSKGLALNPPGASKQRPNGVERSAEALSPSGLRLRRSLDRKVPSSVVEPQVQSNIKVTLHILAAKAPNASSIANFLIEFLERRFSYRFALNVLFRKKLQNEKWQGIKIQISGRLNGAEIARREWVREGRLPLQTLQANIDYSYKQAYTIYGVLGVKVWVFQ